MTKGSYSLTFGPFSLDFPQRSLRRNGEPVRLGSRATGILAALIEARGELVSRDILISRVWPNTIVDEGALRVHLSAVRKALGDGHDGVQYIGNEPGRGYRFLVPVGRSTPVISKITGRGPSSLHNLPGQINLVLGRGGVIETLSNQLEDRRCLTITGPGGIGKTTVAIAIAHRYMSQNECKTCFVDLAPLTDSLSVPSAVATALGIPVSGYDPVKEIISFIGSAPALLVLDNCEHLVDTVAKMVERLMQESPSVLLLVTSREPLRAEGEWVHRLASLPVPPADRPITVERASEYSSVRLFVDRATAVRDGFLLDNDNCDAVGEICRRLDGIPLAIEFAAARADWLDVHEIALRLDTRFKLLTKGRRTALARHQTLRATLDWSYELLDPRSQTILRRISLFRTGFNITAMVSVASCPLYGASDVFDAASDLVAKSLLNCEVFGGEAHYRLLDTTRYYGMELLIDLGENHAARLRHAIYCRDLFSEPEIAWDGNAKRAGLDLHSKRIDDIRAALDWALLDGGDVKVGISLVVVSSFLWFHLSIASELVAIAEHALELIKGTDLDGSPLHSDLLNVYGQSHWPARGPVQSMSDAFGQSLKIAEALGDQPQQMRAIWGLWLHCLLIGGYEESLKLAERYVKMANKSDVAGTVSTGNSMLAMSYHFHGFQDLAIGLTETVLSDDAIPARVTHANAAQIDGCLSAQANMMLFMWVKGRVGKALDIARAAAEETVVLDHELTTCAVLATGAVPVAFWSGDLDLARSLTAILRDRAQRRGMDYWDLWGQGYEAALNGVQIDLTRFTVMQKETFATMGLHCAIEDLGTSDRHLQQSWCQSELVRLNALSANLSLADTIAELERALNIAQERQAVSWQLRTALSLAPLYREAGRESEGKALISNLLDSYTDGFNTTDVSAALSYIDGE